MRIRPQQAGWVKVIAEGTPTYYFLHACRIAVAGSLPHAGDTTVLAALTAALAAGVAVLYRRAI